MQHIGQQWRKKHLMFVLSASLEVDKAVRDSFLNNVVASAGRVTTPLARTMPHTQMFQRKLACWDYNQHGMWRRDLYRLPKVDRNNGISGVNGTREWVPWANMHQFTFNKLIVSGQVMTHRVHWRGYGTDPSMQKGGYALRANRQLVRDSYQYTRS